VKARALDLIGKLRSANADVSWERGEKLHCTVKFLGDTASERVPELVQALSSVAGSVPPFSVSYRSVGCFPNSRSPRVLWIGIDDPSGTLKELQQKIEASLSPLGFEPDTWSFHPHLTLGRVRSPRNQRQLLATMETVTFASDLYTVDAFSLIQSELRPTGSIYKEEKCFPLIGKS
jgi:2'-5' RNA ligase